LYALKSRVRQVVPRVLHAFRMLMDTAVAHCIEIASNFNIRSIYLYLLEREGARGSVESSNASV
jgi:hypothetical protein